MVRIPSAILHVAGAVVFSSQLSAQTEIVSVADDGSHANAGAGDPSISDDGNVVAFSSSSDNLVAGDMNGVTDVFIRDRAAGTTRRVSISSTGVEGNGASYDASVSGDGNFVVFASAATNLTVGDANGVVDIFIHDIGAGLTSRVSRSAAGANGPSFTPCVTSEGRYVAFSSDATNLVSADTNGARDVFVRDRVAGTTERASVKSNGAQANSGCFFPSMSRDGRYVAFSTWATNLDSADVAWSDIYVRDRIAGTTTLVSLAYDGALANQSSDHPIVSDDGLSIAFESVAYNLVAGDWNDSGEIDLFVRRVAIPTTEWVNVDSDGNPDTSTFFYLDLLSMSGDGTFIAIASDSSLLAPDLDGKGMSRVLCRNSGVPLTSNLSLAWDGIEADGPCYEAASSDDGRFVAFQSWATNLVQGGASGSQIYFRERSIAAAAWQNYGSGHPGSHGVPSLISADDPRPNNVATLLFDNSSGQWSFGLLLIGLDDADLPTSWGGSLLVTPSWTQSLALPPYGMALSDEIPADEALVGISCFVQGLQIDPGASDGVAFSAGLELVIGY